MDLSNISKIIKKINRLYEIIESIGASKTEKDLLRAYVVDLYEAVAISPDEKDIERDEMRKKIKKQRKAEKKLKKLLGREDEKAEVKDKKENIYEEPSIYEEDQLKEEKQEEVTVEDPVAPELLELFKIEKVTELSDKLSQKPISDLTKAMGINERIYTINELFGGNKDEFENMLIALNGLENFDQAKEVLMNSVAKKHLWHSEGQQRKARNFIKLVQRRYN